MSLTLSLLVVGLVVGCLNALVGTSFAVIYHTTKTFHVAHAAVFVIAGYVAHALADAGMPFAIALAGACAAAAMAGLVMETVVYRHLRRVGASDTNLLLASLAMLIIVQGVVSIAWGTEVVSIRSTRNVVRSLSISNADIYMAVSCMVATGLLVAAVRWLRIGRLLRAVGDSPDVAAALGVAVARTFRWAAAVGSLAVAPAAVAYLWKFGMTPLSGLNAVLVGVIAVLLVRSGKPVRIVLVAFALSILQPMLTLVTSSAWATGSAYLVLLAAIVLRGGLIRRRVLAW